METEPTKQPDDSTGAADSALAESAGSALTVRDQIAIAILPTIAADESGGTVKDAAKELGIPTEQYDCRKHWPVLMARHAYEFADLFLAERDRQNNKDQL